LSELFILAQDLILVIICSNCILARVEVFSTMYETLTFPFYRLVLVRRRGSQTIPRRRTLRWLFQRSRRGQHL